MEEKRELNAAEVAMNEKVLELEAKSQDNANAKIDPEELEKDGLEIREGKSLKGDVIPPEAIDNDNIKKVDKEEDIDR